VNVGKCNMKSLFSQYKMPVYYSKSLRVLVWIHLYFEHYCSGYTFRQHFYYKKDCAWWFKYISKIEFWLRNKIRPLTKKAKEKYMAACDWYTT